MFILPRVLYECVFMLEGKWGREGKFFSVKAQMKWEKKKKKKKNKKNKNREI